MNQIKKTSAWKKAKNIQKEVTQVYRRLSIAETKLDLSTKKQAYWASELAQAKKKLSNIEQRLK